MGAALKQSLVVSSQPPSPLHRSSGRGLLKQSLLVGLLVAACIGAVLGLGASASGGAWLPFAQWLVFVVTVVVSVVVQSLLVATALRSGPARRGEVLPFYVNRAVEVVWALLPTLMLIALLLLSVHAIRR
jgi:heme/copper-type cytochrome/quinol oxidase subunit 2